MKSSVIAALVLAIQTGFQGLVGPAAQNGSSCPPSNSVQFNVSDWRVNMRVIDYAPAGQDRSEGCPMNIALNLSDGCLQQADMTNFLNSTSFNTTGHLDFQLSIAEREFTPKSSIDARLDWYGGMGGPTKETSSLCGDLMLSVNTTLTSHELSLGDHNSSARRLASDLVNQGYGYAPYDSYPDYSYPVYKPNRKSPSAKKTAAPTRRPSHNKKKVIKVTLAPTPEETASPTPEDTGSDSEEIASGETDLNSEETDSGSLEAGSGSEESQGATRRLLQMNDEDNNTNINNTSADEDNVDYDYDYDNVLVNSSDDKAWLNDSTDKHFYSGQSRLKAAVIPAVLFPLIATFSN